MNETNDLWRQLKYGNSTRKQRQRIRKNAKCSANGATSSIYKHSKFKKYKK